MTPEEMMSDHGNNGGKAVYDSVDNDGESYRSQISLAEEQERLAFENSTQISRIVLKRAEDDTVNVSSDGSSAEQIFERHSFQDLVNLHGIHRTYAAALNNAGALLCRRGEFDKAMGQFQEGIQFRTAVRLGVPPNPTQNPNEGDNPPCPGEKLYLSHSSREA
jgi:hypothetical protein